MPPKLHGKTKLERKKCLANLVAEHLRDLGHTAEVVIGRQNTEASFTDRVVVQSSLGLIHCAAYSGVEPNERLGRQGPNQDWLLDKTYIACGWNDKDDRTLIFFLLPETIRGTTGLTKSEIKKAAVVGFSKIYAPT